MVRSYGSKKNRKLLPRVKLEKNGRSLPKIKLEKIKKYYNMPILDASKELGVCATILKKTMRSYGIRRWPHRKIASISKIIRFLEKNIGKATDPNQKQAIESHIELFKKYMELLINNPDAHYQNIVPKNILQTFSRIRIQQKKQDDLNIDILVMIQKTINNSYFINSFCSDNVEITISQKDQYDIQQIEIASNILVKMSRCK